ncbi:hypothetical protein [Helicobacter trogontum]|nr:hypothetical protein [Helicobacter trogontum]
MFLSLLYKMLHIKNLYNAKHCMREQFYVDTTGKTNTTTIKTYAVL